MENVDCETRTDEDCHGDGLYDYCLDLCGASGRVFGNSMCGHHLIATGKEIFFLALEQPGR